MLYCCCSRLFTNRTTHYGAPILRDQGLINAFTQGKDIHRSTAAEIFGVALDEVTSEQRRNAKAINFGLIYGMSAFGLSRQLSIGPCRCSELYGFIFQTLSWRTNFYA